MATQIKRQIQLKRENEELRAKLEEAKSTIRGIQNLEVDAIIAHTDQGDQVFTLKGAERPYRLFVEKMYEGAATLGKDGTILYANDRFARMLRASLENVISVSIYEFIAPSEQKKFQSLFEQGLRDVSRGEFSLLATNGDTVLSYLSVSAVEIDRAQCACLLATDMREQKLLESTRKENQLHQIESELREQFVSSLSHDLLNPLTNAKISAQMSMRSGENMEMRQKLLGKTIEGIDRVGRMIRDFLDASRIKAGAPIPLKISEFDLQEALAEIVSDLQTTHGDRFILQAPISTRGFWDLDALRRAIENLAVNAVKYGDSNSSIIFSLESIKDEVRIKVHNQGVVIPPAVHATLFNDFSTMKIADAGQRGWGIGLMLVRGVAEAHGGTVHVESTPESGTTFCLEIPRDARPFQTLAA